MGKSIVEKSGFHLVLRSLRFLLRRKHDVEIRRVAVAYPYEIHVLRCQLGFNRYRLKDKEGEGTKIRRYEGEEHVRDQIPLNHRQGELNQLTEKTE